MSRVIRKLKKGFTLLEAVIALAVFLTLAVAAGRALLYSARASERLLASREIFEKARIAMDALLTNIHMAEKIDLTTDGGVLERLVLTELNPEGNLQNYEFRFYPYAAPGDAKYQWLEFNRNELASNIASVVIAVSDEGGRIAIKITVSHNGEVLEFNGAADIRYKQVIVRTS
ncbi:MAG: prepilin-type N-terminal cleavage/methylation domain-containing protein [Clostridiales bacterium]|jgi:prepilin-type N-terminal cleavage/methylation domain-containing protein|nr:prepilin-type N-terminal cleavage/methylation domain-containing protein [Clostridiales bacterium]